MQHALGSPSGGATGTARRDLVIFDLDRTLLADSSLATVARVALRRRLLSPLKVLTGLVRNARYARHGESGALVAYARDAVLGAIEGRSVDELLEVVDESIERLLPRLRPTIAAALQQHLARGERCIVLSASPHELVDRLARELGAERGIGTRGEIVDGRCTGRLDGPFCHGVGKIVRLRAELGDVDLGHALLYTDSSSDLPLLALVGERVVVDPDDELRAVAERQGWPITS
ncbi:MAG: HAD-IB family hydrolase [Actinomycetota bacterium]